jgi:hypothetical protein
MLDEDRWTQVWENLEKTAKFNKGCLQLETAKKVIKAFNKEPP